MKETEQKFSLIVSKEMLADLGVLKCLDGDSRADQIRRWLKAYVDSRRRAIQAYRRKQSEAADAA